jgi:hypothetical protein
MEPFLLLISNFRHRHSYLAPVVNHVKESSIEKRGVILQYSEEDFGLDEVFTGYGNIGVKM